MSLTVRIGGNIVVNGVEYESIDQMPQGVRAAYEEWLNEAGVPEVIAAPFIWALLSVAAALAVLLYLSLR
jgi:hypothetical protein